jgi:hypothetical protein
MVMRPDHDDRRRAIDGDRERRHDHRRRGGHDHRDRGGHDHWRRPRDHDRGRDDDRDRAVHRLDDTDPDADHLSACHGRQAQRDGRAKDCRCQDKIADHGLFSFEE